MNLKLYIRSQLCTACCLLVLIPSVEAPLTEQTWTMRRHHQHARPPHSCLVSAPTKRSKTVYLQPTERSARLQTGLSVGCKQTIPPSIVRAERSPEMLFKHSFHQSRSVVTELEDRVREEGCVLTVFRQAHSEDREESCETGGGAYISRSISTYAGVCVCYSKYRGVCVCVFVCYYRHV